MAGYGYKPRKYGATQTAVSNRQGLGLTPLGISTRIAPKPTIKRDPVAGALTAVNNRQGLAGVNPAYNTPRAPVRPQAPAPPAGAPVAPALSYDYKADPVLNQIQALSSQQRSDAQANATMLKKQLAIDYGDPELANRLGDPATAAAASGNPFSVRRQLQTGYDKGVAGLEESYNNQNLFYSGARAKGLGDFAHDYQGQLAAALGQQQAALGQIDSNTTAAMLAADERDQQAQRDAQDYALQAALAYGIDPGAADTTSAWDQGINAALAAPKDNSDAILRLLARRR